MAPGVTSHQRITSHVTHGLTPRVSQQGDLLSAKVRNGPADHFVLAKVSRMEGGERVPAARGQSHGELDLSLNSSDEFINLHKAKAHQVTC